MSEPLHIILTSLVLTTAGFIIGAVGFGFGLTTSPVLLLFLDPRTVVVVVNTVAIFAFALVLFEIRDTVQYRELAPMGITAVIGAPIGLFLLSTLDPSLLRITIGVLVLALTALIIFKIEWRVPHPHITGPILGLIASASTTGLAIGGPLLVLFFMGRGMKRQDVRASMAFFFTIMYTVAALGYATQGFFTAERLLMIAVAVPGSAFGIWLATRLTRRMNEIVFRRVVVSIIIISSAIVVVREVAAV